MTGSNFPEQVQVLFSFLEEQHGFGCHGSRRHGKGRDDCFIVRYVRDDVRMDIGWAPVELTIGILLRFENRKLDEMDCYVHFEPFLHYLSQGNVRPIIPQVYPTMTISQIQATADARNQLFDNGYRQVLEQLAERLCIHLPRLNATTDEEILNYQKWYMSYHESG